MLRPVETPTREIKKLDGLWAFSLDRENCGIDQRWWESALQESRAIAVPGSFNDQFADADIRNYAGNVWYQREVFIPKGWAGQRIVLRFDAVTHYGKVWVNNQEVMEHQGGYTPFEADVTPYVIAGKSVRITVCVNNELNWQTIPPGMVITDENGKKKQSYFHDFFNYAGIHRSVMLYTTPNTWVDDITVVTHVAQDCNHASVDWQVVTNGDVSVELRDADQQVVATGQGTSGTLQVVNPHLWQPGEGYLYELCVTAKSQTECDIYPLRVGIRSVAVKGEQFLINHKPFYFTGFGRHEDADLRGKGFDNVLMVHDHALMDWIGANSYRTSHYPYAEEMLDWADEHGIVVIDETAAVGFNLSLGIGFEAGNKPKELYSEEAVNGETQQAHLQAIKELIARDKNHPSVVMWSIGNEVPTQCSPEGYKVASFLQDICHREDPTRPVTCGMDQVSCVLGNGFAAMLDVPGFNYRTHRYVEAYGQLPQNLVLGSETASTVSSRGVYKFPAELKKHAMYDDHQSSGYDLEACSWSNVPDEDFALADDYDWTLGQFVWTGFDYLGEPSPYDTDAWPSHSSVFGIIDLASLPKDRYYLYRSLWNKRDNTLHVLPHWTWPGREGENTPVFVYTSYPEAELFVNGKSYGKQRKLDAKTAFSLKENDALWLQRRYRLMWMDVPYEAGELKVVAYDKDGRPTEEKIVRTAGKPHHLEVVADRIQLTADGKDLAYITVRVVDKDGNLCPADNRLVTFSVKGAGTYRAAANGDATCLDLFHLPRMHAFSGQLTAIVQSGLQEGDLIFEAKAKGLRTGKLILKVAP